MNKIMMLSNKRALTVIKATKNDYKIMEHEGQQLSAEEFIKRRMTLSKDQVVNLIAHCYLTNEIDLVWITDITEFGELLYLLLNDNRKKAIEVRRERAELNERWAENTLAVREQLSDVELPPSLYHTKNLKDINLKSVINDSYKDLKNDLKIVSQQNVLLYEQLKSNREAINDSKESILDGTKDIIKEISSTGEVNKEKLGTILEILLEEQKQKRLIVERRTRRKTAKKKPEREYITIEEFEETIKVSEHTYRHNRYIRGRCITALLLLYTTGLRVSNLLLFRIRNINQLLDSGRTHVNLIKNGTQNKQIVIGTAGKQLLKAYKKEIDAVCENKEEEDYVITAEGTPNRELNRSILNRDVNRVLSHVSLTAKKDFRSHSFRATYVTDMLQKQPIEEVRDLIGHQSILTTDKYRRKKTSNADLAKVINSTQSARLEGFKLRKVGRETIKEPKNKNGL